MFERHITKIGQAMGQLVEALCHKPEGHGFESRWCHWNFSSGRTMALGLTQTLTEMSKGKVIPLQVPCGPEGG